jgi:hypothetical protein
VLVRYRRKIVTPAAPPGPRQRTGDMMNPTPFVHCPVCDRRVCGVHLGWPLIYSALVDHLGLEHQLRGERASRISHALTTHTRKQVSPDDVESVVALFGEPGRQ